jgi:hypothetical protein
MSKRLTPEERAARRTADRQRLEQAAKALLQSDGWQQWVRVRSRNGLARYSLNNQILIAFQCPQATYVAGYNAFLALNRCVRRGERAIRIYAPMSLRLRQRAEKESQNSDSTTDEPRAVTRFRAVPVFDVSQTEPLPDREPAPLAPPSAPIAGETHAHLIPRLQQLALELGFSARARSLRGGAEGLCDYDAKEIVYNVDLAPNAQVRVLIHEIAHALGVSYTTHGRSRAEVLVDTVTFIVCSSVGLDVSGSSVPYVAGWGEQDELAAVREYALTIDILARRIERAIDPAAADRSHLQAAA